MFAALRWRMSHRLPGVALGTARNLSHPITIARLRCPWITMCQPMRTVCRAGAHGMSGKSRVYIRDHAAVAPSLWSNVRSATGNACTTVLPTAGKPTRTALMTSSRDAPALFAIIT